MLYCLQDAGLARTAHLAVERTSIYNYELTDNALKTWVRLRQASEAMEKVLITDLDKQGTTPEQIDVLAVVDAATKPPTPGQLSKYLFREQHSVSGQLSRMWRGGLVKKTRQKADQRVVKITVTPKGKELLAQTKKTGMGQARELVAAALSEKELAEFDKLLKKVRDKALEKLGQKAEKLPEGFDVERFGGGLGVGQQLEG